VATSSQYSIHSYVFIPEWTSENGRLATERAALFGYRNLVIPLKDHSAIDPAAIQKILSAADIKPIATSNLSPHMDISSMDADVRRVGLDHQLKSLRLARDMGATQVGGILYGALGKAPARPTSDNFSFSAEAIAIMARQAKEFGLTLNLEIVNRYESNLLNTVDQALAFLEVVGEDNIFLHLDTFHMNIEESNLLDAVERALPRLRYFELDQNHRGQPSEGSIQFGPLLERLRTANYVGTIGIEAFSAQVSGTDVAVGVSAWRALFLNGDTVAREGMDLLKRAFG
jgi:D-psicose/D-tagatose/L-ribulose 3-epimerase